MERTNLLTSWSERTALSWGIGLGVRFAVELTGSIVNVRDVVNLCLKEQSSVLSVTVNAGAEDIQTLVDIVSLPPTNTHQEFLSIG